MKLRLLTGLSLAAALTAGLAQAASVTIVKDNSSIFQVPQVDQFATTGADMDGLSITAMFSNGFSQTLSLADTGATSGGVTGTGWALSVSGDTFGTNAWTVTNSSGFLLTSLSFDGAPGNTLFDTRNPAPGTADSANGRDFATDAFGSDTITATYSNIVQLAGGTPVGDIFASLFIDLSGVGSGGVGDRSFRFTQDTDNGTGGPITPIPLPGALPLLLGALALFGVGGAVRRRTQVA